MERGSDKHGARMDDALESEVRGMMQAGRETRGQEWNSAEPSGEDQPEVDRAPDAALHGGVPEGMTEGDVEERSRVASGLGKEIWPADGATLVAKAQDMNAEDAVVRRLQSLPAGQEFANLQEAWGALSGGHVESHRF
ncbi:MAG TPA: DUF2795 domain-containing protein [Mycobacteriales bacterium]|nr:DUF2795 domain-containing protein [Mycobacteriales bacterium]